MRKRYPWKVEDEKSIEPVVKKEPVFIKAKDVVNKAEVIRTPVEKKEVFGKPIVPVKKKFFTKKR